MAKKKTVVDDMIDDVKDAATSIGEAVGIRDPKQVERIVPIPPINIYSELPFGLVEKNGKRVAPGESTTTVARPKKRAAVSSKRVAKAQASKHRKKAATKRN